MANRIFGILSELIIVHGTLITSKGLNGNIQIKKHPIKVNTSGRTVQQQALLEARRKYMNKLKEAYKCGNNELPNSLNGCIPMLSNKYKPPYIEGGKLNTGNIKEFPVSTMAELDGIRCLIKRIGPLIQSRSRLNNLWPHLQHIKDELKIFFMDLAEKMQN